MKREETLQKQAAMIEDLIHICKVQADTIAKLENPQVMFTSDYKIPDSLNLENFGGIRPLSED